MRAGIKKFLLTFFLSTTLIFSVFFVLPVFAQADLLGTEYGGYSGLGNADPRLVVASIIRTILGFLGVISLILLLYSGFEWMTSMGNDQKVGDAKKRIWYTIIGLVIILMAYAITTFVFEVVYETSTGRFFN